MEDLVEQLTRGNVTEVKVVLASVAFALAFYQLLLIAVAYGKLRLPFLAPKPASFTHRASGDVIAILSFVVGFMCLAYFGIEDGIEHAAGGEEGRATVHVIAGFGLAGMIGLKIVVVRWWHRMSRFLPAIGLSVFALLVLTWLTSSADYLWG